jgi:hypothetical protein
MGDSIQPILMPKPFSAEIPQGRIGANNTTARNCDAESNLSNTMGTLEETTLDEPVLRTVLRDVKMVVDKLRKVILLSADTRDELRNWFAQPCFDSNLVAIVETIVTFSSQGSLGPTFFVSRISNSAKYR